MTDTLKKLVKAGEAWNSSMIITHDDLKALAALLERVERYEALISEVWPKCEFQIGDIVTVDKRGHAEDGQQFKVEKIEPCFTSWGKQWDLSGAPVNGGWIKRFSTPGVYIAKQALEEEK